MDNLTGTTPDPTSSEFNKDQGERAKKMFSAVVLAALDDAIADDKKYGNGPEQIARWARSRDGREVMWCAGIEPTERAVAGMVDFVEQGVKTSKALSQEEAERRAEAKRKLATTQQNKEGGTNLVPPFMIVQGCYYI